MKAKRNILLSVALVIASAVPLFAAPSGHTNWEGWSFDWEIKNDAGIGIRNVKFDGELVLYKGNMPVIRVEYDDDACGPYTDKLRWDNMHEISFCDNEKVCQTSYTENGRKWLELGVLSHIGAYRLYQAWYLSDDGYIAPRLFSKGLHCDVDHDHHIYWRLDFDIKGAGGDQVFVRNNGSPNEGWGAGWHKYDQELNTIKNSVSERVWFVRDNSSGHGVWIIPGADGVSNSFSNKDAAPRIYRGSEDEPWPFGASGHLGYENNENVEEKDVVFWYVAHMHHEEEDGPNAWHDAGPWILVDRD